MFDPMHFSKIQHILTGLVLLFTFVPFGVWGQVTTDTLTPEEAILLQKKLDKELRKTTKVNSFKLYPAIYYTPETRLAMGAFGIYMFKFNQADSNLKYSKIVPSAIYTLNKQVLIAARFELNISQKWVSKGRVGYYLYPYFFSGIGNAHNGAYKEWYDAQFPLLEVDAYRTVFHKSIYAGVKYRFQDTRINSEPDSLLASGNVPGANGSRQSALGFGVNYDTRNFILSPTKGWYAEFGAMWASPEIGSSYRDEIYLVDVRKYIPVFKKKDVLALQVYSEIHTGHVPFNLMSLLGGQYRMRGYQQGVFRDRQMMIYQAEYRSRLFYKYFGFVLFASMGGVGNDLNEVNANYRYAFGTGLRLTPMPEKRFFVRLDYGIGKETSGFYIEIGEAF